MSELIKLKAELGSIRYPKTTNHEGGWSIATFDPIEVQKRKLQDGTEVTSELKTNNQGYLAVKGEMVRLKYGVEYNLLVKEESTHPKFGTTYEVVSMNRYFDIRKAKPEELTAFLLSIMTRDQLTELRQTFDDPLKPFLEENTKMLEQVNGIGEVYSHLIMERYLEIKDSSAAFVKLAKYKLSTEHIKALLKLYSEDIDMIQDEIKRDPFQFIMSLDFDFDTCDRMFSIEGGKADADIRLVAIMLYTLKIDVKQEGNTWMEPKDVVRPIKMHVIGVDMSRLTNLLLDNPEVFTISDERDKIALTYYADLEKRVARKLIQLQANSKVSTVENLDEKIKRIEKNQGYDFSGQQLEAIELLVNNNVVLLEGYGGTGKTTIVKTVLDLLPSDFAIQCALSGKASDNLAKVTGRAGFTIRRLLVSETIEGILPHDIIVIDEFGMVDLELFDELLSCVRENTKVLMVGDSEQLEAIGIPVMKQLIATEEIKYMMLTEIHRQAEKSAVITDSIKIRLGQQILNEGELSGDFVHGELEDLNISLLEDESQIINKSLEVFKESLKTEVIQDVQIIAQTRATVDIINKLCKNAYNPIKEDDPQSFWKNDQIQTSKGIVDIQVERFNFTNIGTSKNEKFVSVGDKVINTKNNYETFKVGELSRTPIFNGNTGIITEIKKHEDFEMVMHVDFEGIGEIAIPMKDWFFLDLAYCITVHKSQGSSCKIIISVIMSHKYLNTRQLLYTAITRVREVGYLITTHSALTSAILNYSVPYRKNNLSTYYFEELERQA